jgi:GT2 family glycosyltransferase
VIKNKGISVIIPNYNGAILLPIILPPLFIALQNTNLQYEVIISDDCSTDDGIEFVKNNYPAIQLLQNKENTGFSKTINKGIFVAQYDYVLLLNSDVILTPNYFELQLRYFNLPDTFGVMGRIIGWDNDTIQDGGKYPYMQGVKIKTNKNYIPVNPIANDNLYSMYLSGANAFVSREKLLQLQGFDEIFSPFYVEDFELSLRAWRMGWKCYYEHNAVCRHKISTTIKNKSNSNYIKTIYNRNKIILHALHLPSNKMWLWYIQLFVESIMQTALCRFYFIKALVLFFKLKNELSKSRNSFNSLASGSKNNYNTNEVITKVLSELNAFEIQFF